MKGYPKFWPSLVVSSLPSQISPYLAYIFPNKLAPNVAANIRQII